MALQAADRVIALRPTSLIDKVWHLAQHFTDNGTFDKRTQQPRVIPEIFLVRLLSAKVCLFVSAANKRLTSYDALLTRFALVTGTSCARYHHAVVLSAQV